MENNGKIKSKMFQKIIKIYEKKLSINFLEIYVRKFQFFSPFLLRHFFGEMEILL